MKQNLIKMKVDMDKSTITVGIINTDTSVTDKISWKKNDKNVEDLNSITVLVSLTIIEHSIQQQLNTLFPQVIMKYSPI